MKRHFLAMAALCILVCVTAFGADDGNAKWRLNQATIGSANWTYDVISTTSGAGNVKGVQCKSDTSITVSVYVNGGSAEAFTFPPDLVNDGFIPFNIRFSSSIRVTARRSGGSDYVDQICSVSWGLD
jgi:hypothetical protein